MQHGDFIEDDDDDDAFEESDFDGLEYKTYKLPEEIKEMCKENIDFDFLLESDERIYLEDEFGFVIFHIEPVNENKDHAFFSIWKSEDYKISGYKYTLEFYSKGPSDEDLEDNDLDDAIIVVLKRANNLKTIFSAMNIAWLNYDPTDPTSI